jgi:hypothetical protein
MGPAAYQMWSKWRMQPRTGDAPRLHIHTHSSQAKLVGDVVLGLRALARPVLGSFTIFCIVNRTIG